jgi:polypeptide N-acetylgalactosaminyltransferase
MCVDSQDVDDVDKPIVSFDCHGQGGNQYFLFTKTNEIRHEEKCWDYAGGQKELHQPKKVQSAACHGMRGNQMWFFQVSCVT